MTKDMLIAALADLPGNTVIWIGRGTLNAIKDVEIIPEEENEDGTIAPAFVFICAED